MKNKWTNGKHQYIGKYNDRFKRSFSKLGIPRIDLTQIFKQISNEKITAPQESENKNKCVV